MSKSKNNKMYRISLFAILFSIINSFIYAFSPGRGGNIPVVDSRNIYFPAIGISLLVVSIFSFLKEKNSSVIHILLFILIGVNMLFLNKELIFYANQGTERKNILEQISEHYPTLPEKVLIFTQSDRSYYGFPDNVKMFPFQLNFGYTLLVWYTPKNHYSYDFTKLGNFLYQITDQGYKEIDGKGFGYFRDFDELVNVVKQNKFDVRNIVAFRYDAESKKVIDISSEIRNLVDTQK